MRQMRALFDRIVVAMFTTPEHWYSGYTMQPNPREERESND